MLSYPLTMAFKIISFGPQVSVTDSSGQMVAYVKQKALKLKEDISIYADEGQQRLLYRVKADRAFDFRASYGITDAEGRPVGTVRREGRRSLWKATYLVEDAQGHEVGLIHEENPWMKLIDGLAGQIPVVGMLSGYIFNPAYLIDMRGTTVLHLKKQPALLEGRFTIEKRGEIPDGEESLLLPSVITTVLLERDRG